MRRGMVKQVLLRVCAGPMALRGQQLKVFERTLQFHGFASQGFVYTDQNNWLALHSGNRSEAFTGFGASRRSNRRIR